MPERKDEILSLADYDSAWINPAKRTRTRGSGFITHVAPSERFHRFAGWIYELNNYKKLKYVRFEREESISRCR